MKNFNFGWGYPPGAENDPNAPWNQEDPLCEKCDEIAVEECCGKQYCEECLEGHMKEEHSEEEEEEEVE
jgi:hypothetical protein